MKGYLPRLSVIGAAALLLAAPLADPPSLQEHAESGDDLALVPVLPEGVLPPSNPRVPGDGWTSGGASFEPATPPHGLSRPPPGAVR